MNDVSIVAAVQAAPVFLDLDRSVDKACSLMGEAAKAGATLAVFPEAFLPGYPVWSWFIPPVKTHDLRPLYAELLENSVDVPGRHVSRLCEAAADHGITVSIGINERNHEASGSTLFNSLLHISDQGAILGCHRKMIPTVAERLVWGQGDGSDLQVHSTPVGKVSGLICWENYMPLARYTLYARGMEVCVVPTWDRGEPWISTMRHIGKEGRSFVISACSAMKMDDIPDRFEFKKKWMSEVGEWLNPGMSLIVDPDGKILAGPLEKEEGILLAEINLDFARGSRFQLDTAGHYARPDVFDLRIINESRSMLRAGLSPNEMAAPETQ